MAMYKHHLAHVSRLGLVTSLASLAAIAAQDAFIVGPRALGMGGTGVATTDDHTAQYYNPAMLGFFSLRGKGDERLIYDNNDLGRKDWGFGLIDVGVGVRVHGELLELADVLVQANKSDLGNNGISTANDIKNAVGIAKTLATVDDPGNAVTVDANVGSAIRIGHFTVGARVFAETSARVNNVDLLNVAFQVGGAALATNISTATGAVDDNLIAAFSGAQSATLIAALGGGPTATDAVQKLDFEIRQQGLSQAQIDQAFIVLNNAATSTGATTLADNTTVVRLGGFALGEIPISYGWAIGENLSIGATLKAMFGRVMGSQISIFKDDVLQNVSDIPDNYQQSVNVGIDLGIAWRTRWLQVGAIGRNLNAPSFDGFTDALGVHFADVRVDPQVALGVAFIPWSWLTVALDADLLAADTTFSGYQTQRVGLGLEFTPGHVVALRAGAYQNIAESDIGPVITAGFGLNLWAIRIDLAAASSLNMVSVGDSDLPDEIRVGLGIMADF